MNIFDKLKRYRIVERKDKRGKIYYAIESRCPFGRWKWIESDCQMGVKSATLKYQIVKRNVRFADIESAKEHVIRYYNSKKYGLFEVCPIIYVDFDDKFTNEAWYIPLPPLSNVDNYFNFASMPYDTIKDAHAAIDKWLEEKEREKKTITECLKYRKVVYKF